MKSTLLLDGSFFLYKSISAKIYLTHKEIKTSMYYLLLNSIKSITKQFKPDKVIILWDSSHYYRKDIYPDYKKKKPIKDENILSQLLEVKKQYNAIVKTMKNLGFASYRRYGYEADDLFAMYINQYPKEKIIIASRDEDLFQLLIDGRVTIFEPKNKKIITEKSFTKEYKITPTQWILYKAINGCFQGDNIPGIPGVGPVTTLKFLQGFSTTKERDKIDSYWKTVVEKNLPLVALPFNKCFLSFLFPNNKTQTFPLRETNTKLNMDIFSKFCQLLGFRSFLENLDDWEHLENL